MNETDVWFYEACPCTICAACDRIYKMGSVGWSKGCGAMPVKSQRQFAVVLIHGRQSMLQDFANVWGHGGAEMIMLWQRAHAIALRMAALDPCWN